MIEEACYIENCNTPILNLSKIKGFIGWSSEAKYFDVILCEGHRYKLRWSSNLDVERWSLNEPWAILAQSWIL